jgi:hypothetical protein
MTPIGINRQTHMNVRHHAPTVLALCGLILAGCGGSAQSVRQVTSDEYFHNSANTTGPDTSPGIAGEGGITFGVGGKRPDDEGGTGGGGIGVNAYLWRATLDTLSFMPLVSADPMGGVIITDWWQTGTQPRERFKATAYILSRRLRSDGIKVTIFRQVEQNGQWVDTPVAPSTRGEIEDKIIARARELRAPFAQN